MSNKILLIDNNEFSNLYFRDVFWIHQGHKGDCYEVISVSDIESAKAIMKEESPVIVFLEPNAVLKKDSKEKTDTKDAVEFIQNLKAADLTRHIPIVAYSNHQNKDLEEIMLEAGADHFLVKGKQTAEDLVNAVENILSNKAVV